VPTPQNSAVLRACAAAAAQLAVGGDTVVVDGVIGPWYLDLVTAVFVSSGIEVHYVVLRPALDITVARATGRREDERVPGHPALVDEGPIRLMWKQFQDLGPYDRHVVDTGPLDAGQTAAPRVEPVRGRNRSALTAVRRR
jgi:hypothetical protein